MGQVCYKVPTIHNQTILNQIFMLFSLNNTVLTVFSGIIQNPVISVWQYHMPFFSNVETQVSKRREGVLPNNSSVCLIEFSGHEGLKAYKPTVLHIITSGSSQRKIQLSFIFLMDLAGNKEGSYAWEYFILKVKIQINIVLKILNKQLNSKLSFVYYVYVSSSNQSIGRLCAEDQDSVDQ